MQEDSHNRPYTQLVGTDGRSALIAARVRYEARTTVFTLSIAFWTACALLCIGTITTLVLMEEYLFVGLIAIFPLAVVAWISRLLWQSMKLLNAWIGECSPANTAVLVHTVGSLFAWLSGLMFFHLFTQMFQLYAALQPWLR